MIANTMPILLLDLNCQIHVSRIGLNTFQCFSQNIMSLTRHYKDSYFFGIAAGFYK